MFFFFNDTATTEIYPLPLHDALPILADQRRRREEPHPLPSPTGGQAQPGGQERLPSPGVADEATIELDRKSTRLNSSHQIISYAVFCLKKKKLTAETTILAVKAGKVY